MRLKCVFGMVVVLALAAPVGADTGAHDSVIVGEPEQELIPCVSNCIPIRIVNGEELYGFSLGFEIEANYSTLPLVDSLVFVGRMADPQVLDWRFPELEFFSDGVSPDTVTVAAMRGLSAYALPVGDEAVVELWLTPQNEGFSIDSCWYPPSVEFKLAHCENNGEGVYPAFEGTTLFHPACDCNAILEVATDEWRGTASEEVSFAVDASDPGSVSIDLRMPDGTSHTPTNEPKLAQDGQFTWEPTAADVGYWEVTFGLSGLTEFVRIEVMSSTDYLVTATSSTHSVDCWAYCLQMADLNGDAAPEAVLAGYFDQKSNQVAVYEFSPATGFQLDYHRDGLRGYAQQLRLGFMNCDFAIDAVFVDVHGLETEASVLLGDGDGNFAVGSTATFSLGSARGAALGDLVPDGHLDYAVAKGDSLCIYSGDGDGDLVFHTGLSTGVAIVGLNCADFNRDGFDDLAVGCEDGLRVYFNDGTGGFTLDAFYPQAYGALDIEVTNQGSDFNDDGFFDLCLATPSVAGTHSELVVYFGSADGSLTQSVVRNPEGHILANCAVDFNGDGDLDIAYVNGSRDEVVVLYGDGAGNFANESRWTIEVSPLRAVEAADMDLDGDMDLVMMSSMYTKHGELIVLHNQHNPSGFANTIVEIDGRNNAALELESESGLKVSRIINTMPAAEHHVLNADGNDILDEQVRLGLVESGEYRLKAQPKVSSKSVETFSLSLSVDGVAYRLADEAAMSEGGFEFPIYPDGASPVTPAPGSYAEHNPPVMSWPGAGSFHIQIARDPAFEEILVDEDVSGAKFTPTTLEAGSDTVTYYWRVKASGDASYRDIYPMSLTPDTPTDVAPNDDAVPDHFALKQNYPNPFNPSTTISFSVPKRSPVELVVYNVVGQRVTTLLDEVLSAGNYQVEWNGCGGDGRTLAGGVYFYRLSSNDGTTTKKMLLLK